MPCVQECAGSFFIIQQAVRGVWNTSKQYFSALGRALIIIIRRVLWVSMGQNRKRSH